VVADIGLEPAPAIGRNPLIERVFAFLGNLKNSKKQPWGKMRFGRGRFQSLRRGSSPPTFATYDAARRIKRESDTDRDRGELGADDDRLPRISR
jgi:hypothetical protein